MKARGRTTKRKATTRRTAPKAAARALSPVGAAQVRRELADALEQQKAAAEILRIISSSPGDLKAVFNAILTNATRLCHAKFGNLWLHDG
ncbi:MAG: hypothetical protein QOE50_868, partial [Sphingomonadales bacterium]|nr:hypothetical protein [Sphingomonadales bacterium]